MTRKAKKVVALVVGIGVILAASILFGFVGQQNTTHPIASPVGIRTNDDRVAYLQSYGWQVVAKPAGVEELLFPEEFDETYSDYLTIQSGQGFDLTKYAGKRVKRYTYEITNYPTGESGVIAGLLVYKNTVIGGEVLSGRTDGFLHGLSLQSREGQA